MRCVAQCEEDKGEQQIFTQENDRCQRYCRTVFTTDNCPFTFRVFTQSFRRNSLPQRNLAPSIPHPASAAKLWNSVCAYGPPGDILQNISNPNGFHYLMISNIMYLNDS